MDNLRNELKRLSGDYSEAGNCLDVLNEYGIDGLDDYVCESIQYYEEIAPAPINLQVWVDIKDTINKYRPKGQITCPNCETLADIGGTCPQCDTDIGGT